MKYYEKKLDRVTYKMDEFGSIHELVEYLEKTEVHNYFVGGQSSIKKGDSEWSGTSSYEEAIELLGSGWTTMAAKLQKRVPAQTKSQFNNKSRPVYSVVGGTASIPRYLMGIPTNMIDKKQIPMKSKIIVINKDMSYSGGTSPDRIMEEGVKALQIIQALEGKGYRVRLNMGFASREDNEILGIRVTIKKPEERLSLQKVAFPIANPAMLRRIGLNWIEKNPNQTKRNRVAGHGRPATTELKKILDEKEIFLPNFIPNIDKFIEELKL